MEKWQQEWEKTGVVNLPINKQPCACKGFIHLMCKEEASHTFYTEGIITLDDNLQPKEFLGCFDDIHFSTKQKDVKEEEFEIKELDTKLYATSYTSDKYRFLVTIDYVDSVRYGFVEIIKSKN